MPTLMLPPLNKTSFIWATVLLNLVASSIKLVTSSVVPPIFFIESVKFLTTCLLKPSKTILFFPLIFLTTSFVAIIKLANVLDNTSGSIDWLIFTVLIVIFLKLSSMFLIKSFAIKADFDLIPSNFCVASNTACGLSLLDLVNRVPLSITRLILLALWARSSLALIILLAILNGATTIGMIGTASSLPNLNLLRSCL